MADNVSSLVSDNMANEVNVSQQWTLWLLYALILLQAEVWENSDLLVCCLGDGSCLTLSMRWPAMYLYCLCCCNNTVHKTLNKRCIQGGKFEVCVQAMFVAVATSHLQPAIDKWSFYCLTKFLACFGACSCTYIATCLVNVCMATIGN